MREALTRLREAEEANEQQLLALKKELQSEEAQQQQALQERASAGRSPCSRTSNSRRPVGTVTRSTKAAAGKRDPASVRSLPKKYAKLPRASGSTDR